MRQTDEVAVLAMTADDAVSVADLHCTQIRGSFLSGLGCRVLARIYRAVPASSVGFGFVAERGGRVEGFIACATHLGRLYRTILLRQGPALGARLIGRLFRPRTIRGLVETFFYPRKVGRRDLPQAEVLSMAIAPELRGRGAGWRLMLAALDEFRRRGCTAVKVLVGAELEPANAFYRKLGFRLVATIQHHGQFENIYLIDLETTGR